MRGSNEKEDAGKQGYPEEGLEELDWLPASAWCQIDDEECEACQ